MDLFLFEIWLLLGVKEIIGYQRCRVPFLEYGRARTAADGQNVRFNCRKGYQLMGPKYAHCVRGAWDAETPVCIKAGCKWNRYDYFGGLLLESYRGALVKVECYPGYTTGGPKAVYCDGRMWNGTFPECNPLTDEPAKSCDFDEDDLCGWLQDPGNKGYDWNLSKDQMGQSKLDHSWQLTETTATKGQYIHFDSYRAQQASGSINITSRIYSPVYPTSFTSNVTCFSFWYFMRGASAGLLKVYLLLQGHVVEETIPDFWVQGDQGPEWNRGIFQIERPSTHYQIVIEGSKYGGFEMAVDDVNIGFDSECEEKTTTGEDLSTTTDGFDTVEDFTCRNRCGQSSVLINTDISYEDLHETMKCDCHERCLAAGTCCEDFKEFCDSAGTSTEFVFSDSTVRSSTIEVSTKSTSKPTTPSTTSTTLTATTMITRPTTTKVVEKIVVKTPSQVADKEIFNAKKNKISGDSTTSDMIRSIQPQVTSSLAFIIELSIGIAAGFLVLASAVLLIMRRRSQANEEFNMAEDSDVRLLTSDEFLDFSLARPRDEES